ncbi:golgi apparatus membrane protein-like protein tvp23 [Lophiostoma macrostomum CBS 122681]|uniref:Golgi apparatus membrane protein TVP23 n=1 Tax=Lophiostoma macrostomum CBS 122681 TaxID=1314788 RepID=A0A6A6TVE2_9PLEO|nr:golgi apparatus membrane protein-like protein tvp23 [Lophiostoma macrostomum CBS 122681]
METAQQTPAPGSLSWRLSSHPITLLTFLFFRISSLLVYLFGLRLFTSNFVLIFIITILLLATDFYYLKNIAGRRLVGLRWWNEVDTASGDSRWVFESFEEGSRVINATDKRFFWIALYAQPVLWILLAVVALASMEPVWLTLVGEFEGLLWGREVVNIGNDGWLTGHAVIALVLTVTNTLAFSRCDKFSQASGFASTAVYGSGLARNLAGGMVSNLFSRGR